MAYTYDGCCGSCIHMNTNDYVGHKDHCYCTYRRQYYNLTEKKCSYYQYDSSKDYYDLNKRWHIVSAILQVLPEAKAIPGMNLLSSFRVSFLEQNNRYDNALMIYDLIGPFLAMRIINDVKAVEICRELISGWLINIISLIEVEKNAEAFIMYAEMVDSLITRYHTEVDNYLRAKSLLNYSVRLSQAI